MTKQARQFAIREIINTSPISNQDELRREVRKRGFPVTQATLSRDLKELGIVRVASNNGMRYIVQPTAEAEILRPVVGAEVLSISANESMIVVQTLPGCASSVGEFIDVQKHTDIIGTIAGDNTLLVIPISHKKTKHILKSLKEKLIEGK
ncbi:MAG: arginine repressor [Ignavibacteriae bacterium]|nr:arginine repressor [Ignavibacteriota bacterium]